MYRVQVQYLKREVTEANEEIRKLKEQLEETQKHVKEAQDNITKLNQCLNEARAESTKYQQLAEKRKFCFSNIEKSDKDVHFYTGLPSASVLYELLDYLSPGRKRSNIVYRGTAQQWTNDEQKEMEPSQAKWRDHADSAAIGRPSALNQVDELFLMLVRLRLNLNEQDLANRFEISASTVSQVFITWINFCYLCLGLLPCWPGRSTIQSTMPASFKELYPHTTAILDATEIRVNIPSSLLLQSQTYSNYKSANTLKALIAISPDGHVIFVSSLYTGCISDTQLVERSGFLSLLQEGDEVMADRGFTIEDLLLPLGVKLNIPPFLGERDQMEAGEVVETQQIASLRIHIERAIRRVKEFDILSSVMPASVASSANQIWTVCSLLTNFQNPLISC
ncbi:uncharacterized protein [Dysidea avara]|uniref:uncharacterized protein n=1 Tax=Dysidea avara TaxID=196820 RepID=UPI003322B8DE